MKNAREENIERNQTKINSYLKDGLRQQKMHEKAEHQRKHKKAGGQSNDKQEVSSTYGQKKSQHASKNKTGSENKDEEQERATDNVQTPLPDGSQGKESAGDANEVPSKNDDSNWRIDDPVVKLEQKQQKAQKQKLKILKVKPKKLIMNISSCKYPIVRKIAKYEFGHFLSARDMFAPVNGQIILDV